MNTTLTAKNDLITSIQIDIVKADYEDEVKKTLKQYQHKAILPGFRQGKVPFGMIERMHGQTVKLDVINKMVSETLNNQIIENKLDIIGYPLPDQEKEQVIDIAKDDNMTFYFEVANKPKLDINFSDFQVNKYNISITDKEIDNIVQRLRENNKKDDQLPELNEEFFNLIFPGADIKDIDSFRKKIYDELDIQYNKESERMFYNNAVDTLINNITFNLPDDFLKRLIIANSEGKLTREEVDQNYEKNYLTGMKWQLIEDYIVGKYPELAVNEDDLRNFVKTSYFGHLNNDTMDDEMKERMNNIIDTVLKDQQQRSYITNQIISNKLTTFFNENLRVEPVNVNYEEFMKATMPELDKKEEVEETKE